MIQICGLSKSFAKNSASIIKAVDNVDIHIKRGEFIAIVGPSGSGKSTLMNIIGLLDKPSSGKYELDGKEVASFSRDELAEIRNKKIGFVFQQFHLLPKTTAKENVEIPLIYSDKKNINGLAANALGLVGLKERINHIPTELSGGQQQRVAIARALVNDPEIILADEPTGNLDLKAGLEVMTVLQNLNKLGKTIILITHDKEIALHTKRILEIVDGKIVSEKFIEMPKDAAKELHNTISIGEELEMNGGNK